jgi:hypothetical protein
VIGHLPDAGSALISGHMNTRLSSIVTIYLDEKAVTLALANRDFPKGIRSALEEAFRKEPVGQTREVTCTRVQANELDQWFRTASTTVAGQQAVDAPRLCLGALRSIGYALRRGRRRG